MAETDIVASLPAALAARVQSARIVKGRALVVLDAAGLDAAGRTRIEAELTEALSEREDVDEVQVIQTAERTARRLIAVGSGKGGVGKSTLAANLAIALQRLGHKVGLVDADIYGPSQPMILDTRDAKPEAKDNKLIPVESRFGVPVLSMGHLVKQGQAIAWRGPMAGNALSQLIDAHWGETEILIVDLPPGTGDVQLTMLQKFKPAGAVLVSTPQDLALIDAVRAGHLFDQAGVPVIGLVENMAGYVCPHCGELSDPFGAGGVEAAAAKLDLPFLGRIPLALEIREGGDAGAPPAASDGVHAKPFSAIAERLFAWLAANG
jgi:ATP-binding protein involved in chromosome partitioning